MNVSVDDALIPNVDVACVSTFCVLALNVWLVPSVSDFACMITFCFALMTMSPADSILMTLFAESSTILFFFVLSTIVIFSEPSLSSKMIR